LAERYNGQSLWAVNDAPAMAFDRVHARLQTLLGIVSVAATSISPFESQTLTMPFLVEGRPLPSSPAVRGEGQVVSQQTAAYSAVTPGFFATMRIPVIAGRDFDGHDTVDRPFVAIINQTMARRYFSAEDPIGKRIRLDWVPEDPFREIVAVVGDVSSGPLQAQHEPAIYVPHVQQTARFAGPMVYTRIGMYFVLRTLGDPMRQIPSVKGAVAEVDQNIPVANARTIEQTLDSQIRHLRLYMLLLGIFAATAAVLAATGIYGVMAHSVAERTREIGIRMALGGRPLDILKMVLGQVTRMIAIGLLLGLAGALSVTRTIQSLLFEVSATDPATFAAVLLFLLSIATFACFVPTRRAASVNPAVTLKSE
jgi:putative ABC transport system permease protein